MNKRRVMAVILAAGEGRRMGGRPKALVDDGGETWLERAVRVCRDGGCADVVVVARADSPEVAAIAASMGVALVDNPDPDRGMFSSVVLGLAAACRRAPSLAGVVVHPVDHPGVTVETVRALCDALRVVAGASAVVPTHDGLDGHPTGVGGRLARALLTAAPTEVFRDALASSGAVVVRLPVNDPGVLDNVNTPR